MSFFDPHHVYDKKKRNSHKGQIIQKRLGTRLIPPMSREELARVENYLLSNGLVTKDKKYSKTLHKIYRETDLNFPSNGYIVFHFPVIYNNIFKNDFEWEIPTTGTALPKFFEVMIAITRVECLYKNSLMNSNYTINTYIPDRTDTKELSNATSYVGRHIIYTMQDVSFCQINSYQSFWNQNYTNVNNYSYLTSYHSYDVNNYRKFALGSDIPFDEVFAVGMGHNAPQNVGDVEIELFVTINYTY